MTTIKVSSERGIKMKDVSAVILAGGVIAGSEELGDVKHWALALIDNKPMIHYVAKALREAGIEDIVIVGAWTEGSTSYEDCRTVVGGWRHIDNIEVGLKEVKNNTVLLCTCDIPALTAEAVRDFIKSCETYPELEVGYPISRLEDCQERFPEMDRTAVKMREGEFTGGNIFWFDRLKVLGKLDYIRGIIELKKKPFSLIRKFGLGFTLAFIASKFLGITRYLTIERLENKGSEILGLKVKAVLADPSIASDIDTLEQYNSYLKTLSR
ncbi:MAG: nucleotidyltransferase family protein [Patescibacteria group bacterium]|nr:nucleotidyltransferase family protein [Patescibacteria group bacterium]